MKRSRPLAPPAPPTNTHTFESTEMRALPGPTSSLYYLASLQLYLTHLHASSFSSSFPFPPSSAPAKKSATPKVTAAAPKAASAAKSAAKSSKGSEEEELGKTIAQVSGFCSTLPLVV